MRKAWILKYSTKVMMHFPCMFLHIIHGKTHLSYMCTVYPYAWPNGKRPLHVWYMPDFAIVSSYSGTKYATWKWCEGGQPIEMQFLESRWDHKGALFLFFSSEFASLLPRYKLLFLDSIIGLIIYPFGQNYWLISLLHLSSKVSVQCDALWESFLF